MRRRALLAAPLALAGCGLSERPYAERRAWPLEVPRPQRLPPRRSGRVLLVRAIRAGPGLEARGLQSVQPDGSIRTAFYEEWAVPPARGVEDALRRWLADSGLFAGVLAPGSRVAADLTLEGELTALWTDLVRRRAVAALGVTVIATGTDLGAAPGRVLLQRAIGAEVDAAVEDPPRAVGGLRSALAQAFAGVERACAEFA